MAISWGLKCFNEVLVPISRLNSLNWVCSYFRTGHRIIESPKLAETRRGHWARLGLCSLNMGAIYTENSARQIWATLFLSMNGVSQASSALWTLVQVVLWLSKGWMPACHTGWPWCCITFSGDVLENMYQRVFCKAESHSVCILPSQSTYHSAALV